MELKTLTLNGTTYDSFPDKNAAKVIVQDTAPDDTSALWVDTSDYEGDNLQAAINTALAQAKSSGEFDGKDGQDGYTPQKGIDYFDGQPGKDGKDGNPGADGYTPVKGKDYFDGEDGQDGSPGKDGSDGVSATHSWNGPVLTITSASGTSSANLKGEKGDKGDKGDSIKGDKGDTGATGQRGTGLLPVTTAPSSYTTAVGGITPKYRMEISTIKSQAGVTEVLLGDTVRYSYYHYPIAYLDASYAYMTTRVSIRGATGAAGADGADGKTAYQYAQDGGYTGTETEFAAKLAGGASASALQTFIDNTDVDYAYDAATGVNYTVIRVYRDKIDGTKQFPFVHHEQKTSTYDLVMEHGFCLAINAGVFNTTTGAADGIVIQNGVVLQDGQTTTHPQCLPLTIDEDGNLSYASYNASASELVANGIVSAVTGFMPIIIDYQEYAQSNWNSVAHYTENTQRQIIGQFGNGDYAIVTCEGRNHQNSDGWTIAEAQSICKKLGLKFAYNLDGGGSTETMYGYKHINTIYDGTTGRKVPTFIVFTGSTTLDVTPEEIPETFAEVEYIETSGDAFIRTDITEAAIPFDYEAKILSTIDQNNITTENNGNGHLFSATNTWYPFLKLKDTTGEVMRKINGTENSSGAYSTFVANKWYVLSSAQSDGSNVTNFIDVASNKSLYTSTKVNGSTYDASKTFCICAYGADAGQKRLRFFGKLSYIKLSLNGELVHHFVAAKSNKTGVYGLLDKVTGVFHRSTSGTEFTGA